MTTVTDPAAPWPSGELTRTLDGSAAPPSPGAPPPAPPDLHARISELMQTAAYQRGDKAATEEVHRLFQVQTGGPEALAPTDLRHDLPAVIDVPPDLAPDVPGYLAEDVSRTLQDVGLSEVAAPIFAYAIGRGEVPTLPTGYHPPSMDAAEASLRASEGRHYERQLAEARLGAQAFDLMRTRLGRPAGEWLAFLVATGAGNDPAVVRLHARLAGRWDQVEPQLMAALRRGGRR